jgi:hypothetical protein
VPFPHLMNLFLSGVTGSATNPPNEELHRLFDYLTVPSPFVGTETWANPALAAGSAGHAYHPPFNRISSYREPGRINLNTIYGELNAMPPTWRGVMEGSPGMNSAPSWQKFVASRRGSSTISEKILDAPVNASVPTEFAHPFRSSAGATLVPPIAGLKPSREINATLLRETPAGIVPTQGGLLPPLFQGIPGLACNNGNRNPYFYYQGMQRLGNLVTTRSNVYAIWITVGYFEVTPGTVDAAHPDGYRLDRELGIDTGETQRHRSFYIIDRTLPVAFQRGQDLNTDKVILVNRFIE